jgi:hypothetical protein
MVQSISRFFGYYPLPITCRAGMIEVDALPSLKASVETVSGYETIDDDWVFCLPDKVRRSQGAGNRIFSLPKTHTFTHGQGDGSEHVRFHVWALSFFCGMRLTTTDAGFVDATPVQPERLIDFSLSGDFENAVRLAETFWTANRHSPENAKLVAGIIHALFMAQNPRLFQFEEFTYLYAALDASYRLARTLEIIKHEGSHSDRVSRMCDAFGIVPPSWATKRSDGRTEIAIIRNAMVHEALFVGEPLGFALHGVGANQNLVLEMSALICRLLVSLLGASYAAYVRSPINRRIHSLVL